MNPMRILHMQSEMLREQDIDIMITHSLVIKFSLGENSIKCFFFQLRRKE